MKQQIGIIGAGQIGQALARHLVKAGYPVLISNSRGAQSLEQLAVELGPGATAVSAREAANTAIVILAVQWGKLPDAVKGLTDWSGKIVIDATNNIMSVNPFILADLGGKTTGQVVSDLLPGASIVKAFNTLGAQLLAVDPVTPTGNRVIFFSGDDPGAKKTAGEIIKAIGFHPIDLGTLSFGGKLQEVGAQLSNIDLYKANDNAVTTIPVVRRNTEEVQGTPKAGSKG